MLIRSLFNGISEALAVPLTTTSRAVLRAAAGAGSFRGRDSLWRIVTISAASRLADLMGATRSTEKPHYGGDEDSEALSLPRRLPPAILADPTEYRSSHYSSRLVPQIKVESDGH